MKDIFLCLTMLNVPKKFGTVKTFSTVGKS